MGARPTPSRRNSDLASGYISDESGDRVAVQRAIADIAASTTHGGVVAGVAGKKIRVLAAVWQAGGTATTIQFGSKPGGAGTFISPVFASGANGFAPLGYNPHGWMETVASESLSATTGAGSSHGILVTYALVD